jgi:NAD-dependent dihydropyrimidine dehydrogenase PreA subunit
MKRTQANIEKMLKREIAPEYRELAIKIKETDSIVMPYVLGKLMNLEQAKILNALPDSPANIAKRLQLSQDSVDKHFQEMFEKGLVYPGKSGWHLTRSWASLHDSAGSSNPKYDNDEFFDLAFAKSDETVKKQINEVLQGQTKTIRQGMRVIPRWRSIKDIPGVLPNEDIKEIFKGADPIVLLPCACKNIDRNRMCRDTIPVTTCIVHGRAGQYNLNRGTGRKLTYDEVIELLDSFDKFNLVHLVGNYNSMPYLVCNCHNCCCGSFYRNVRARKQIQQFSIAKSRFIAVVNPDKCKGCKTCITRCPVDAIKIKHYPENEGDRAFVMEEECIGCGLCVITCPAGARELKIVRPPEYIPQLGSADALEL